MGWLLCHFDTQNATSSSTLVHRWISFLALNNVYMHFNKHVNKLFAQFDFSCCYVHFPNKLFWYKSHTQKSKCIVISKLQQPLLSIALVCNFCLRHKYLNWYTNNYRAMNFHGKKLKSHNNLPKMMTKTRSSRKQQFWIKICEKL